MFDAYAFQALQDLVHHCGHDLGLGRGDGVEHQAADGAQVRRCRAFDAARPAPRRPGTGQPKPGTAASALILVTAETADDTGRHQPHARPERLAGRDHANRTREPLEALMLTEPELARRVA